MSLEKTVCDLMESACGVETWFGAQPQGTDEEPAKLPVVIVNRPESEWFNTFCGVDGELTNATMRVDYWASSAEASRRLADKGRKAMMTLSDAKGPLCPMLQTEVRYYEPIARAWRNMQQWLVPDYQPSLPDPP